MMELPLTGTTRRALLDPQDYERAILYIGRFPTLEQAATARSLRAKELFGEFAA